MPPTPPHQPPRPEPEPDEPLSGEEFILPGGKLDPDAIRAAVGASESEDDEAGLPRVTFKLTRDLDKRLDKYLTDRITFMSRSQLQRLIDEGGVSVNGRKPKAATKLRIGDEVTVVVPPPPSTEIVPEDIPIEVLFEDEHIIVINKSPDIIVHPARSHNKGTLVAALAWHFRHRSPHGGGLSGVGKEFARPGVVHRLDRRTSGVMVAAKSDEAHWKLGRQFELRQTDKRYLAVVHGVIEPDADVIDQPIGPHPSKAKGQREKMVVRHDELGKHAVTIYRVRQRFPDPRAAAESARTPRPGERRPGFTLVELELKTGRTHQIRVHLSHMGFPIAGDDLYGGAFVSRAELGVKPAAPGEEPVLARQALHAAVLGFKHPISEQPMRFTAPLRSDMAEMIRLLRAWAGAGPVLAIPGASVDLGVAAPQG